MYQGWGLQIPEAKDTRQIWIIRLDELIVVKSALPVIVVIGTWGENECQSIEKIINSLGLKKRRDSSFIQGSWCHSEEPKSWSPMSLLFAHLFSHRQVFDNLNDSDLFAWRHPLPTDLFRSSSWRLQVLASELSVRISRLIKHYSMIRLQYPKEKCKIEIAAIGWFLPFDGPCTLSNYFLSPSS